ncbi:MAG: hypothetical protein ABIG85_03100 [Chloroflexota bacterium]
MSLGARVRMRPLLYPAAILLAFVLNFLVDTGVSPYAAARPLIVAFVVGVALPWSAGLATGDRHLAGLMGGVLVLFLLAAQAPIIVVLCVVALILVGFQRLLARRRAVSRAAGERLWPVVTRVLTAGGLILLVAVGVKAAQLELDRIGIIAHDLVAESPFRAHAAVASSPVDLPNMYFILLDGYPRADKLKSEFGIDVSGFTRGLGDRGFFVATHSRSNYTITHLTLAQMFNYAPNVGVAAGPDGTRFVPWRHRINEGRFFSDVRGLGYEVVAVSPAFEHVALRQADRFIDTGQLNEFEWNVAQMTGVLPLVDSLLPSLAADLHRARVLSAFDATEEVAGEASTQPRFVFTHVVAPHSPQVFQDDGAVVEIRGFALPYDDRQEASQLGLAEYSRRLGGHVAFLNTRTLALVDRIIAADPAAVVVVFSDDGSKLANPADRRNGADLGTANLLAVRSPGKAGIIDDRSTLANLLPRLLRAYTGTGPPDVPETIFAWAEVPGASFIFERPD